MAVITLPVNEIDRLGLANPAGSAVNHPDSFAVPANDGEIFLRVAWGALGGTLIFTCHKTMGHTPVNQVDDLWINFNASEVKWLGPYPAEVWNDANGQLSGIHLTGGATCTMTAFRLKQG